MFGKKLERQFIESCKFVFQEICKRTNFSRSCCNKIGNLDRSLINIKVDILVHLDGELIENFFLFCVLYGNKKILILSLIDQIKKFLI